MPRCEGTLFGNVVGQLDLYQVQENLNIRVCTYTAQGNTSMQYTYEFNKLIGVETT